MEKQFNPASIETKWYQWWEEQHFFKPDFKSKSRNTGNIDNESYCIAIPPPNVTGSLHMGHAFQQTIMDFLIRYQRMQGKDTLWQVGTDHAGIATQMVVERQLQQQNIKRHDLGRDAFIDKVWEWKAQSGDTITQQMRRLGTSTDWERERFTMDEGNSTAVTEVFVRLFEQGLLYRGKRLVNWDPKFQTAISDLEVENIERDGQLWHFRYPLADGMTTTSGSTYLEVATTRPETMLGDSAVAVHPNDERYQSVIGGWIDLPLTNRRIPIVADQHVDPTFGSGCVKITPAHDFNDYDIGKRHQLPLINILDASAHVKADADCYNIDGTPIDDLKITIPPSLAGLDRFVARKALVKALDELGLLGEIKPHKLKVPEGDRSNVPIEPLLTDQWFVKAAPLAEPALAAVENGDIKIIPENYQNMYYAWMRDIQDWCVSRQLWWGHRIPAWYDDNGSIYVGRTEDEVRQQHQLGDGKLTQDNDVLDTWFSSALWTFATLGWPDNTDDLKRFHPTSVLVTGFDIIFFWVARMIMMTMHFMDEIPFKEVYVTGLVRDERGQKMSKSKGNVIDPLDMIDGIDLESLIAKRTDSMMQPQLAEKISNATHKAFPQGIETHGTDALRFTLAALASTGRDINWDMQRLQGYRNFCNKIWNASRFVLMSVEGKTLALGERPQHWVNRWIESRLNHCIEEIHQAVSLYRFDRVANLLHEFIWHEYCDWYLELTKPILNDSQLITETASTLVRVLEQTMRLAHPLMPFITEEIWQTVKQLDSQTLSNNEGAHSIMLAHYPQVNESNHDIDAEQQVSWLQSLVNSIRTLRAENTISPAKPLEVYCRGNSSAEGTGYEANSDLNHHQQLLDKTESLLLKLANLSSITWVTSEQQLPLCATAIVGSMDVLVNIDGLVDVEQEHQRLMKEISKLQNEKTRAQAKLSNQSFVANAPEQVVAKERERLANFESQISVLQVQLNQFNS